MIALTPGTVTDEPVPVVAPSRVATPGAAPAEVGGFRRASVTAGAPHQREVPQSRQRFFAVLVSPRQFGQFQVALSVVRSVVRSVTVVLIPLPCRPGALDGRWPG